MSSPHATIKTFTFLPIMSSQSTRLMLDDLVWSNSQTDLLYLKKTFTKITNFAGEISAALKKKCFILEKY